MQPKVSIVVPIYGVEKYLHQCVESILAQTLQDIEIILVDDGSKDKCPEIVDYFASKDTRVVPIHQENGGYGVAVNHGISVATGEYIGIVESDDYIEPTMYEKLYNSAVSNDTDITKCAFYRYDSTLEKAKQDTIWTEKQAGSLVAPKDKFTLEEFPLIIACHSSVWAALYKADFIKAQKFTETSSASYQDVPFMLEAFCRAKDIYVVHEPLYHYRNENMQNSSSSRKDERLMVMLSQLEKCKAILKQYNLYDKLLSEFYYAAFNLAFNFYLAINWSFKRAYLKKFRALLKDAGPDFSCKYLSDREKNIFKHVQKGHLIRSLSLNKTIRRFLINAYVSKQGYCFQFLGIQLASYPYNQRLALIKLNRQ